MNESKAAAFLKSKRSGLGLSQRQAAKLIGVQFVAYQKWENGKHIPTVINCYKLSKVLNFDIMDLIKLILEDSKK